MSAEPWAEVYQAVRAHERMLNEATSRFEHAVLAPLVVLNGGAVVAFLTLLGALMKDDLWHEYALLVGGAAVLAWVFGLVVAVGAVRAAFESQRQHSIAYRLIREQLEYDLFPGSLADTTKATNVVSRREKRPGGQRAAAAPRDAARSVDYREGAEAPRSSLFKGFLLMALLAAVPTRAACDRRSVDQTRAKAVQKAKDQRVKWLCRLTASTYAFLAGSILAACAVGIAAQFEEKKAIKITRPIAVSLVLTPAGAQHHKLGGRCDTSKVQAFAIGGTLPYPKVVTRKTEKCVAKTFTMEEKYGLAVPAEPTGSR
jgi:hypothetical protein